jgi:hypothetical protein
MYPRMYRIFGLYDLYSLYGPRLFHSTTIASPDNGRPRCFHWAPRPAASLTGHGSNTHRMAAPGSKKNRLTMTAIRSMTGFIAARRTPKEKQVRWDLRLRVLHSLPRRHQQYFFGEIRNMCGRFIVSLGLPSADRTSAAMELCSEVMAKLLGATSAQQESSESTIEDFGPSAETVAPEGSELPSGVPTIDDDPARDGRIIWLLKETCGQRALPHRYEDMRRRQWGRWQGTGYRTVQISSFNASGSTLDGDEAELARAADPSYPLQEEPEDVHRTSDASRAWIGLQLCASRQFGANDDVADVLDLIAHDPSIQEAFGTEWPVTRIVETLNARTPSPLWSAQRVDNARKRLKNWILRMKRDQGLDSTDIWDLFARVSREQELAKHMRQPRAASKNCVGPGSSHVERARRSSIAFPSWA